MTESEADFANIQDQLIEAKRDFSKLNEEHMNLKKQFFEAGERYKSNLRAIMFLLSEIQAVVTHHEKDVAIRYIKSVIEKHIIKGVGYYPQADYLPF